MRLGTSTTMGFNRPHGVKADIPDVVRILAEAGFKVQDMNFHDCSNFPTPLLTDKWESWVDDIGNTSGLLLMQRRLPGLRCGATR